MNPEDRLRDALSARAGAARTSPDALDGVFTKVSRHKRNVRVAAAAGAALSLAAVSVVASAALRTDGGGDRVATSPSVTVSAAPAPSTSLSPSPSPSPSAVAPRVTAFVARADDRIVEIDVASGAVLRTVVTAPGSHRTYVGVSRDHRRLAYSDRGCHVRVIDLATGKTVREVAGSVPALSPDGDRVAVADCDDSETSSVVVTDLATGTARRYAPAPNPTPTPGHLDIDRLAAVSSLAWVNGRTIAVARMYESEEELLLLDVRDDRWLTDGDRTGAAVGAVATRGGPLVGDEECCYPEWDEPTKVVRVRASGGDPETLFTVAAGITSIAVGADGTILYTSGDALWRWNGGRPRLLLRGAVAVTS